MAPFRLWLWMMMLGFGPWGNASECPVNTTTDSNPPDSLTAVHEAYPNVTIVKPTGNPFLGRQNYTYCCILALGDFLRHDCDKTDTISVDGLTADSQFPCGASYAGDEDGAPAVYASFSWTQHYCPGWQIAAATSLRQWMQLLVSFVLPAVIFCLNIPRRRKFRVWHKLFLGSVRRCRLVVGVAGAVAAMVVVVIDTMVWLFTMFAVATPALQSGLYEAYLDRKMIDFLEGHHNAEGLPPALRTRMLLTILCGNLDLYPAWVDSMQLAAYLDVLERDELRKNTDPPESPPTEESSGNGLPQETSDVSADPQHQESSRLGREEPGSSVIRQNPETTTQPGPQMQQFDRTEYIGQAFPRLTAMLECQYSFGSFCGGPILFYIGSFLYTLLDIRQSYGDADNSHALAFGIWYMIIPLISIVSGCLLGGNNPYTLQGIVGIERSDYQLGLPALQHVTTRRLSAAAVEEEYRRQRSRGTFSKIFDRVYQSAYQPVAIWNRGRNKQRWILALCADSLFRYEKSDDVFESKIRPSMKHLLTRVLRFNTFDWICFSTLAISLVFTPCVLAFAIAFSTPQVGLACRSLCFVVYLSAQALLTILWMIRTTWRDPYWRQGRKVCAAISKSSGDKFWAETRILKEMARNDIASPDDRIPIRQPEGQAASTDLEMQGIKKYLGQEVKQFKLPRFELKKSMRILSEWAYRLPLLIGIGVSVFSGIGGSLFQLTRIFENNVCKMNVTRWLPGHRGGAMLLLSTNSRIAISRAKSTWTISASLSMGFLVLVCYGGWWYQTRLRQRFKNVARKLGQFS